MIAATDRPQARNINLRHRRLSRGEKSHPGQGPGELPQQPSRRAKAASLAEKGVSAMSERLKDVAAGGLRQVLVAIIRDEIGVNFADHSSHQRNYCMPMSNFTMSISITARSLQGI